MNSSGNGRDIGKFTSLPRLHLLAHKLEVPLCSIYSFTEALQSAPKFLFVYMPLGYGANYRTVRPLRIGHLRPSMS